MPEERKLITVLFADIVGSTALGSENDPEVVRSVMARYFERMKGIAETHGGSVEKFIGDAVMVVFGVPRAHDDDAERAVRAALAMRDALPALNAELGVELVARVGVNSGEAVTGAGEDRQFLVTGDAVNIGARLQQNADAGEVVVGALTERLTRQAIEYRGREPIRAKGKAEPLVAFSAVRPRSAVPEQARGLPQLRAQLVGRQRELRLLLDTFARVREERRAHLFTVVGNAGVGKSRLVGETLARIGTAGEVRVLRGRCLPYGAGITWWPFAVMLREDASIAASADRASALERLESRLSSLVPAERDRRALGARLSVLLGLQDAAAAMPEIDPSRVSTELAWAVRRYVEALARATPLALVIDDLQWGEPPFVEAVEQIAERVREAPLLLLCVARPELLESRPGWGSGKANATVITLDPLSPEETRTLVARLLDIDGLPEGLRAAIVARSEGNPLFCEEFLRVLMDEGAIARDGERWSATSAAGSVRVPETIQAVLTARLDLLAPAERRALQVASVVGERFDARELSTLDPACGQDVLDAVIRKGLAVEDVDAAEATGLRFKHLLIRDAAYASLPKAERGALHERFGHELERERGDRSAEVAEILAHHAERAFSIAVELRAPAAITAPRALRALDHAIAMAERALARGDLASSERFADIGERAVTAAGLPRDDERSLSLAVLRVEHLARTGKASELGAAARPVTERALAAGHPRLAARARKALLDSDMTAYTGAAGEQERIERDALETLELYERAGDGGGVLDIELLRLDWLWAAGRLGELLARGERLLARAVALGDGAREAAIAARIAAAASLGGRSAEGRRYLQRAERLTEELGIAPTLWLVQGRAGQAALGGDYATAEARYRENLALAEEWGIRAFMVGVGRSLGDLYLDLGRVDDAQESFRAAVEESKRIDERWTRTEALAGLAVATALRGDLPAAEALLAESEATVRDYDVSAVAAYKASLARIRALQGRDAEAEALFRAALEVEASTEYVIHTARAELQLAEFLASRGRGAEASALLATAEARIAATGYDAWRLKRERVRALLGARARG